MLTNLIRRAIDAWMDQMLRRMLTDPYTENIFADVTIAQKMGLRNLIEANMRAETGRPVNRPIGTPMRFSPWEKLLFQPVHLFRMPTPDGVGIDTAAIIGPRARQPLKLDIPIMIAGMSYGGALGIKAKIALARGASMAGTATNTGEAPLLPEERAAADKLMGQFNRGGWLNDHEQLRQLDAIEIQVGQGAQGSTPQSHGAHQIDDDYRRHFKLARGQNAVIHSRLPGVDNPREFVHLVRELKQRYPVPVGLKFAASHYLEREIDVALAAEVDFITVDGAEGGTHGGPTILQDDFGLPTLYAVARAADYLRARGARADVTLLAAGGLMNPGHFLKAMALGANVLYIGTVALSAMIQTQVTKAAAWEPPPQLVLYMGKFKEDLDVEKAAEHLAKFLKSCTAEMTEGCYSLGHESLTQVSRADLVALEPDLARALRVDWAAAPPERQPARRPVVARAAAAVPAQQPAPENRGRRPQLH